MRTAFQKLEKQGKRKFAVLTRRNFQTLSLDADGMGATVYLRDALGKKLKTSNTFLLNIFMQYCYFSGRY